MNRKKILFLTGTRADFGKLKSLIIKVEENSDFETFIFVTGMHMISKYGMTAQEVENNKFNNIYKYINQSPNDSMDIVLSKTIQGLSDYPKEICPDMIVVHGARVEALAGAIVGSLNNILVAHIEGGEVSGTIDELIRHSVSKMAHLHFVSNENAVKRLLQLGERKENIFNIGSPDLDLMISDELPNLISAKDRYNIDFEDYGIFMYHPVTTEYKYLENKITAVIDGLIESNRKFVVIYPNNDLGTSVIIEAFSRLEGNKNFKIFPSIRFEYFLTLLKNSSIVVGNSSAGVREAPFYGIPTLNLGSRQNNRAKSASIVNIEEDTKKVSSVILSIFGNRFEPYKEFGLGNSNILFHNALVNKNLWATSKQKEFIDN